MSRIDFTVSIKDLREEHFRGSGNGGQKKQKTSSGVRLTHEASGVQVESEATRSQASNRIDALRKLANHPRFISWCRMESAARAQGFDSLTTQIKDSMRPENLRIEITSEHAPNEVHCDTRPVKGQTVHDDDCGCFGCRYTGHAGR